MRIYYSICDPYPAYRADVAELFGVELSKLGLQTDWFMKRADSDQVGDDSAFLGQRISLPPSWLPKRGPVTRLGYWVTDAACMVAQLWRRPDAIQCRDKFLVSLVGLVVARLLGVPFFYWCSYPFPEHAEEEGRRTGGLRGLLLRVKAQLQFWCLYRLICPGADHVFVQSRQMLKDMASYGISEGSMTPVPMGVSTRLVEQIGHSGDGALEADRVVYLGTLAAARRLEFLVEVWEKVKANRPQAELWIVGDGDRPSERLDLERKFYEHGLSSSVRFTGFLPLTDALAIVSTAKVCLSPIYPSQILNAGSPTKLVEYMALGRPVVCNTQPEQAEIMASSGAGLCVDWSASAFAAAILELLNHPTEAEAMARKGPPWVAEHRSYPLLASQVLACYQRLMKAP